jgi:DNA repair protein RecN (Recombination protein N)
MLVELRIRNLAIIDDVTVRLGAGLNVLTGETGAGKSIIVGALSLLLGERASSEVVRSGAERASIEGVFQSDRPELSVLLDDHGIEPSDGGVILKREIALEGRNRVWINGSPSTAAVLGEVGGMLVSLHGQHQHQTLLRSAEQRSILDEFGGHSSLVEDVGSAHARIGALAGEIERLEARRREVLQRSDFLRFQLAEIDDAAVRADEEELLEEEARRLSHAEELISLSNSAWLAIAGGGDAAAERLSTARRSLDQLIRIDPAQRELMELFETAHYSLEELGTRLESYGAIVEQDPQRLEAIRRRQDLLYRLRSKYGPTLADVLSSAEAARTELALLDDADLEIGTLRLARDEAEAEFRAVASRLTARRREAAEALAARVGVVLPDLGMTDGCFEVALTPLGRPGPTGAEDVEFRVSLNRGFEPRPLSQVASGGELSRVMLALKTILAGLDRVPTLVFDEVDAGIGGRVALQVGDKMRSIARDHQVLAITHLPQIASRAHLHLQVRKTDRGGDRMVTFVTDLDQEERVLEIARMLGGDSESAASLAHARELLERGARSARGAAADSSGRPSVS